MRSTLAGLAVAAGEVGRIDVSMGHGDDGLEEVVEDDHAVVEAEAEVGQTAVVRRRLPQPLDIAHGVVSGIADAAAEEARQPVQGRRAIRGQFLLKQTQRIGVLQFLDAAAAGLQADAVAVGLEAQEGAEPRKL